jgi:dihydrofolate reductase
VRKLVESTFMSLDGVISDPQVWGPPYWDEEHAAYNDRLIEPADALLLGRATYEVFAQSWPARAGDPFADRMNAMPKYVASRTLEDATWNATVLGDDVAGDVARIKQEGDGDLVKYGTGELDELLIRERLLDELHLWIFPVIAGSGDRLLDGTDLTPLRLLDTTTFGSGIVVHRYTLA